MSPRKTISLFIFGLVLALNLFWLPSFSFWRLKPKVLTADDSKYLPLANYQHPPIPVIKFSPPPSLTTSNYILLDSETNQTLVSSNPHGLIYPASTTKLATALTALNVYPLDEIVTVPEVYSEGKVMELQAGEKITVRSLVTALLVYSANDAAYNLAAHYSGGVPNFIKQMNLLAQKYNLKDTHFTNFDGIHNPDHYSSVYDLSQLARVAIKSDTIKSYARQTSAVVTDKSNTISHPLITTNELLGKIPEIEGLKTGWTPEAGGCFVGLINLNGHYLISVVAQSSDRFADTESLLKWAKTNLSWREYSP